MNEQIIEWINEWIIIKWVNEWIKEWMNKSINESVNKRTYILIHLFPNYVFSFICPKHAFFSRVDIGWTNEWVK